MRYSIEGYRRNSPDKDRDYNIIPSGHISMRGVDFPIIGIDEYGVMQYMQPGQEYFYPGNRVLEIPEKQYKYSNNKQALSINDRRNRFVEHVLNNQDKFDKSTINKAKYIKSNILNKRQDGGNWDKIKSTVKDIARPIYHKYKKLTTPDYSDKGNRHEAYAAARKAGEKEFMWNNGRYNTDMAGTAAQQLQWSGITNEQLQNRNFIQERLSNNLAPVGYDNITSRLFNAVVMNKKDAINYISNSRLDAYNLYVGKPQTNNTFSISRYIPSKSKDKNVIYYSLNNDEFKDRLINLVNEEEDIAKYLKFIVDKDLPSSRESAMGKFFPSVSEDNNGKYIAYYDKWDLNPLNLKVPFTNKEIPTDFGKPFEIYDRIYYRDNPNYNKELFNQLNNKLKYTENLKTEYDSYGNYVYRDIDNNIVTLPNNISYLIDYQNELKDKIKNFPKKYIRQYYSDKELSELDPNKRNFDTLALQRELNNRGYKLPKSTKEDGTFDGIWGDETKNALLEYQKSYKQDGGMTGMMKARVALDSHFGNETARRMTNYDTRNYKFDDGSVGNVYVSSYDNLVTPHIQLDENNNLIYVDNVWSNNNKKRSYQQSMKFERPEDAEYFGKNYKRVVPMKKLYQDGGQMQQEIIEAVKEYIKKGATPEQLIAELQKQGVSAEEAKKVVMIAMSQLENNSVMNYGVNPNEMNESYGQEEAYPYYELGSVTMGLDTFGKHNALPWALPENTFGTAFKAIMGLGEGIRGSVMGYKKLYDTIKGENKDIGQSTGDVKDMIAKSALAGATGGASELEAISGFVGPMPFKDGGYHLPKAQFAGSADPFLQLSPELNVLDMANSPQTQSTVSAGNETSYGIKNATNNSLSNFNPFSNFNSYIDKLKSGDFFKGDLYNNYKDYQSIISPNNAIPLNYDETTSQPFKKLPKLGFNEVATSQDLSKKDVNMSFRDITTKEKDKKKDVEGFSDADRAIAGFRMFNEALSDRDYAKEYKRMLMRTGNTDYRYNPMNPVNPYGEYTPNVGIGANYALVGNTPIQDFGTKMASAKYGKMMRNYKAGGEYTISKEELDYILSNGGEVEFL